MCTALSVIRVILNNDDDSTQSSFAHKILLEKDKLTGMMEEGVKRSDTSAASCPSL